MLLTGAGGAVFSPTNIAGLKVWFKADAGAGTNDGDAVGTWTDQSASANNVTQSTVANKPTYKTAIKNGLPIVRFDGTNDSLTSATGLPQGDFTLVIVGRLTTIGSDRSIFAWGVRSNGEARQFHSRNTDVRAFIGYIADVNASTNWSVNTWYVWTIVGTNVPSAGSASATITHRTNGTSDGSGTASLAAFTSNSLVVGANTSGTEFWAGDIAEILQYDSALSGANIDLLETYINNKWAVY